MIRDKISRLINGGPIEVPKTDLSSKVDKFLFHTSEALRLSGEIGNEMAFKVADITTSTSKLLAAATAQTPPKATP